MKGGYVCLVLSIPEPGPMPGPVWANCRDLVNELNEWVIEQGIWFPRGT